VRYDESPHRILVRSLRADNAVKISVMKTYKSIFQATLFILLLVCSNLLAAMPSMTVYKTASCSCCLLWVEHMKAHGFSVAVKDVQSTAEYVRQYGVPGRLQSCHTAVVGGYAIEGHVPAADVQKLLKAGTKAKGLAVPGMPVGSPGMEQGQNRQAYSVLMFDSAGKISEFQKYPGF
jgi:hypothetical protein